MPPHVIPHFGQVQGAVEGVVVPDAAVAVQTVFRGVLGREEDASTTDTGPVGVPAPLDRNSILFTAERVLRVVRRADRQQQALRAPGPVFAHVRRVGAGAGDGPAPGHRQELRLAAGRVRRVGVRAVQGHPEPALVLHAGAGGVAPVLPQLLRLRERLRAAQHRCFSAEERERERQAPARRAHGPRGASRRDRTGPPRAVAGDVRYQRMLDSSP
mmetsp:Transcript_75160/g.212589  ORF Transcript_75160/g.212589 Transcript_75160/m.212589 type:complete len:214 (+) Transcript_75160:788-1429(+)